MTAPAPHCQPDSAYLDELESLQVTVVGMREEMAMARSMIWRLEREKAALETLRPVWAQGWTSDSRAAQASGTALASIWQFLQVTNQTDAMEKLRELRGLAVPLEDRS